MIKFILLLLFLFAFSIFGYWLNENTSVIQFDFFDYTVEVSFTFALFVLVLIGFAINYGVKLLVVLISLPEYIKNYFANRSKEHLVSDLQKLVFAVYANNNVDIRKYASSLTKNKFSSQLLQKGFMQFVEFVNSNAALGKKEIAQLLKKLAPEVKSMVLYQLIKDGKADQIDVKAHIDSITTPNEFILAMKRLVESGEIEFATKSFYKSKAMFKELSEYEKSYQEIYALAAQLANDASYLKKALELKTGNPQVFARFLEIKLLEGKSRFIKYVFDYFAYHYGVAATSVIAMFLDSLSASDAHEFGIKIRSKFPDLYEAQLLYIKACALSGFHNEAYAALSELYANFSSDSRADILKAELTYRTQGSSSEVIDALKKAFLLH